MPHGPCLKRPSKRKVGSPDAAKRVTLLPITPAHPRSRRAAGILRQSYRQRHNSRKGHRGVGPAMEIRAAAIRIWPSLAFRPTLTHPALGLVPPTVPGPKGGHDRINLPEDRRGSGGSHRCLRPIPGAEITQEDSSLNRLGRARPSICRRHWRAVRSTSQQPRHPSWGSGSEKR